MVLKQEDIKKITRFVKKEPRTVQEIAKHIGRSWMTADSYVEKIGERTGLLKCKVFRAGTKGALKIVYWNYEESVEADEVRKVLYNRIRIGTVKTDFDPFEIYQYIPNRKKKAVTEIYDNPAQSTKQNIVSFLRQTESELVCFSGNNSWLLIEERGTKVMKVIENLLKRGVHIKIVSRVDLAAIENLNKLSRLTNKYPDQIEIRHAAQPLRGFIIDGTVVRLKDEKERRTYRKGELKGNLRVFYEWTDPEWVGWMQQVFWNLYRSAPTAETRLKQLNRIF